MADVISCVGGTVKKNGVEILDVIKWTVAPKADNVAYASSSTGGYKKRVRGIRDLTGSIELYCNDTTLLQSYFKHGMSIPTLSLYENGTLKYEGPALIEDISVEADIAGGQLAKATANFGANGAWADFNEA